MQTWCSTGLPERLMGLLDWRARASLHNRADLQWRNLSCASRFYIAGVIAVGAAWAVARFQPSSPQPILFVTLLVASCVTSTWKVNLALPLVSGSTLSVSYAANLAALVLLGPDAAMIIGAAGVWTQCTFGVRCRYPLYRTAFSTAAQVITIQATGLVYVRFGGGGSPLALTGMPQPLVAAIATYFVVNTGLVAAVIALSSRQAVWKVWHHDFLWSAPSFMVAGAAGAIAAIVLDRGQWAEATLMLAPVYLTYRTYHIFLGRLEDQRRHAAEAQRLHNETLEALLQARRTGQALAQEKERLAVTLRSIGDGVVTTDLEGTVLLMNEVGEKLTGWTQDEAVGRPLGAVFQNFDPETRERLANSVPELLRTGAPSPIRCTVLVARDLTEHPIEEIAAPLRDSMGRATGMVLAFRDISDAIKAQTEHARASKSASLGLLAGGIAGDFNNLLMTIMGNVSMARVTGPRKGLAMEALTEAERACVRARQLTWSLLSFANGGVLVRETIAMTSVLQESVRLALGGSKVSCRVDIAPDLRTLQADKRLLIEALKNVLVNARESMSPGGVVEIGVANVFEPAERWEHALRVQVGHYVSISIADRGAGIASEYLGRIFDPYFSNKPNGSGLGLATVHSIVKGHGGFISVDSALGRGTTVRLNFPAVAGRTEADVESVELVARGKPRILVMDDEASNRILSANMLQFLGYDVDLVGNGSLAVEQFRRALLAGSPFDAVMLDLTVPGEMGGREAIDQLAAIDPAVKAILVSGHVRSSALEEFGQYGFKAVLTKPFSLQELSRTIDFVIGTSSCRVH